MAGEVALRLTLNGQQLTDSSLTYRFVNPVVSFVSPSLGPARGSSQILVGGIGLAGGTHYLCKFSERVVSATYDIGGRVRCLTPPWMGQGAEPDQQRFDLHRVAISLSLNGQQVAAGLDSVTRRTRPARPTLASGDWMAGDPSGGPE